MKKLVVVLAVAFSGVLNAQNNIVDNFTLNDSIKSLTIASKNNSALSYDSLIINNSLSVVDSLIDVRYESILNSKFSIDVYRIDNGIVDVLISNNDAFKPENFDQTDRNILFITTLNNIESAFLSGVLFNEITIVFSNLEK
jgi:hypothetical protein